MRNEALVRLTGELLAEGLRIVDGLVIIGIRSEPDALVLRVAHPDLPEVMEGAYPQEARLVLRVVHPDLPEVACSQDIGIVVPLGVVGGLRKVWLQIEAEG